MIRGASLSDWLFLALAGLGFGAVIFAPPDLQLLAVFLAGYGLGRVRFGRTK